MSSIRQDSSKRQKPFDLQGFLTTSTSAVNAALNRYLPSEKTKPATIHKAMRYSLFAGGKRMRPALCLAAAAACGGRESNAMPLACAVECIHTYSLVHDDLPAMDNDDYRRGKLTNHKVFGEGMAILAGDALLTQAFEIAAQCKAWPRYSHQQIFRELTWAAGSLQLIAGQVADLEGEGKKTSAAQLKYIHERKTSALLCCSVRLGGMSANCTPAQLETLTDFGYHVGLAFQVIDDILDVTQTSEKLGKTAGKDTKAQKATYPSIVGLEKSRKIAEQLTDKAFAALKALKGNAVALETLAEFLFEAGQVNHVRNVMQKIHSVLLHLGYIFALLLCGCIATGPAISKNIMGNLEVRVTAPQGIDMLAARIYVDGIFVGNVSERLPVLYLKRGRHVVRVEHEGTKPYEQSIDILGDPNHQFLNAPLEVK